VSRSAPPPLAMLPPTIPIFPLPNVVLFPGVFLPLHIFEERYRAMTRDALVGDRIIGMALLQPDYEREYEGRPAIYRIGCAGLITHSESLPDGRFNIVLRGLDKFEVIEELPGGAYRRAHVATLAEPIDRRDVSALRVARPKLESLVASALRASEIQVPADMEDQDFLHALCQYLNFSPGERQALLQEAGPVNRCGALIELLEMQVLLAKTHSHDSRGVH
jgi:Lon protease-like protein